MRPQLRPGKFGVLQSTGRTHPRKPQDVGPSPCRPGYQAGPILDLAPSVRRENGQVRDPWPAVPALPLAVAWEVKRTTGTHNPGWRGD
eukprot:CAMPEP_0118961510 /NCGR_PEP_ID=MMETSP1173-20130426/169_1 /TAXON_ID=1034831 /ORGANISM="Rhizochromulina marina cf, Strain CCMP1243" /LENGTH=87 /DNA_ID=CAMNT_0006909685 /DNA_START=176 /DNA_END=439 /DNA_ORIENTATION=-